MDLPPLNLGAFISSLLAPTVIAAAVSWISQHLLKRRIDRYFDREMERYRQELSVLTERAKYLFQRQLHDHTLFATKRHEVYAETMRLLQEAAATRQMRDAPETSAEHVAPLPAAGVRVVLEKWGVEQYDREMILHQWDTLAPNERLRRVRQANASIRSLQHERAMHEALRYMHANVLFYSQPVFQRMRDASEAIQRGKPPEDSSAANFRPLIALRELMQRELTITETSAPQPLP